ncbi:MAG: type II secretion system F family protein [Bacilli bacterium]
MQDFRTLFLFLIVIFVLYVIFFIIVVNRRTSKYIHKFHSFALSNNTQKQSILDSLNSVLWKIINFFSLIFSKSKLLTLHSKSFDKYIAYEDEEKIKGLDLLSAKLVLSFGFFIGTLILSLLDIIDIPYIGIVFMGLFAYFVPNFILNIRFSKKKENVLKDILDAVYIINTSLKNKESIYRAVDLVVSELDGAICDEFKKISRDLEFGLSICEAFKRFDNRMKLDVTGFISEILDIYSNEELTLQFNYIESVIATKFSLKKEAEVCCFGVKILVRIILFIPMIIGFILLFNPDYAKQIFDNIFGIYNSIAFIALISLYSVIAYKVLEVKV